MKTCYPYLFLALFLLLPACSDDSSADPLTARTRSFSMCDLIIF